MAPRAVRSLRLVAILALALTATACETLEKLNPFDEKKKPLPGERQPVFPEGVPGVTYSAPPPQPANANLNPSALQPEQGGTGPRNTQ